MVGAGGASNHASSEGIINDEVAELLEFDHTIAIAVELVEQSSEVLSLNAHLKANEQGLQLVRGQDTVTVSIELTENVTEDHLFGLITGKVENLSPHGLGQVLDLLSTNAGGLILTDLPHGFHHLDEVFFRWCRHGEISVVVSPFLLSDLSIVVSAHTIKAVKELTEDLLSGLPSINEVLVVGHVINCVDVLDRDSAIVAAIDKVKGLVDHGLTASSEWVSQATDELLVGDVAISINIVVFHKGLNLDHFGEEAVPGKSLSELALVQLLVAVIVHATEENTERADTDTTTLLDLHLELVVDTAHFNVKANTVELRHLRFCFL